MTLLTLMIILGTAIAFYSYYFIVSRLMHILKIKNDMPRKIVIMSSFVASPFVWFLSFVIGGTLGGAIAGKIVESTGLSENLLIPIGIGIGIGLITMILLFCVFIMAILVIRIFNLKDE